MHKVLHIGKYYSPFHGGIENYTKDLVESKAYQDNVVPTLLVHQHINSMPTISEKVDSVEVIRVKKWFTLLYSPISPSFITQLNHAIDKHKPDLLHIHMPNLSAFACILSVKAKKIPWVIHWHSDVIGAVPDWRIKFAYKGYKILENLLLKKSKAVIATTPHYLSASKPLSEFINKSYVVPLGVKNDVPNFPEKCNEITNKLSLLIIGRLTYYKGHKYLLEAVAQCQNVELIIIGVGELESDLKQQVKKLNINNRVKFLGNVDKKLLNDSISKCDLLCLPSIEKTEAFGLVLLEAARLSTPALVTNVYGSGMSWVVQDKTTGLVVEPSSVGSLITAIDYANKNRSQLIDYGHSAHKRFEAEFNIERVAKKTLDVYNQLLNL